MCGVQINPVCTLSAAVTAQPLSVTLGIVSMSNYSYLTLQHKEDIIFSNASHLLLRLCTVRLEESSLLSFFVLQGAEPSGLYLERDLLLRDLTQPAVSRFRSSA